MRSLALDLAFAPLLPWLIAQGRGVRRDTPRLPPADGSATGAVDGLAPALRVVLIGESTVAGVGAATHADGLAGHFARDLRARCGRRVEWSVFGLSGATVRDAHTSLLSAIPCEHADLIVIAFGVNDVLERTPPARFAAHLRELIAATRGKTGHAPVLLAAVPPMGRFPALPQPLRAYVGARARMLDGAMRRLRIAGVAHVRSQAPIDATMFARDRFHPSSAGYLAWAGSLAETAIRLAIVREAT